MPSVRTSLPAARRTVAGLPFLVAAGLLWGTGGLTGTLLARTGGLGALAVAAYRLGVGGALILGYLAGTGRRPPRGRSAWVRIGALGALGAAFQGCYFGAVALTSVSFATLVAIGASPVLVLAGERLPGRRRADRSMLGTVALALAGLGLLVGLPAGGYGPAAVLGGAGLAVGAAAGFATMTLVGAHPVAGLDDLTAVGFGFTAGGLLLAPIAAATAGLAFHPGPAALGLLVALGAGPTALAYTCYLRGLRSVRPATAAVLALLEPLTAAVLAAAILHERLGPAGIAGAVLLAVAVLLAARRRSRPASAPGLVGSARG